MEPATDYRQRLTDRESHLKTLDASLSRFGTARLALAVVILIAAWFAFARHAFPASWLLLGVAAFAGLVIAHQAARRAQGSRRTGGGFL